ncbi:MAG TPA: SprB repeat-containing protein [Ferruginibacter sp.]|nr:SprB repeat-containing protein [Ferruginibacter sp.]
MKKNYLMLLVCLSLIIVENISCKKSEIQPPADPCAGKSIAITETVTPTSGGSTSNGSITVTASGSNGFSFSLNNGPFQASGTFSGLAVATYTITAKDQAGCTAVKSVMVAASPCPTIAITATSTLASTQTSADGSLTATATGSTGITYAINGGAFQTAGVFNGLVSGSYNITVKDVNGCTASATFIVSAASCPTITIAATTNVSSGPTATDGSISATANGGIAPYTYSINSGTTFQSSGDFSNLTAGSYTIIAKDANGCLGTSGTIVVASSPCPVITINSLVTGTDKCSNNTGTISVTASGSNGFTYSINGGSFQASNVFNALATGNYLITANDVNGCTGTNNVTMPIGNPGTNFSAVKNVLANNCAISGCHAGSSPQNGLNFTDDCTIVNQALRIKSRAVDANPSVMPPTGAISNADRQKIVDWINSGATYSN